MFPLPTNAHPSSADAAADADRGAQDHDRRREVEPSRADEAQQERAHGGDGASADAEPADAVSERRSIGADALQWMEMVRSRARLAVSFGSEGFVSPPEESGADTPPAASFVAALPPGPAAARAAGPSEAGAALPAEHERAHVRLAPQLQAIHSGPLSYKEFVATLDDRVGPSEANSLWKAHVLAFDETWPQSPSHAAAAGRGFGLGEDDADYPPELRLSTRTLAGSQDSLPPLAQQQDRLSLPWSLKAALPGARSLFGSHELQSQQQSQSQSQQQQQQQQQQRAERDNLPHGHLSHRHPSPELRQPTAAGRNISNRSRSYERGGAGGGGEVGSRSVSMSRLDEQRSDVGLASRLGSPVGSHGQLRELWA